MDFKPRVSVVMSTYNGADQLPDTIDSVLAQTLTDFEFIIINDGSTDSNIRQALTNYVAGDSRIKIINKGNQGITMALVGGCSMARGDFIARIDVGDVMASNRLQLQKEVLAQYPDVGLVSCWTEFCAPEWEHLWISKGAPETRYPVDLLSENPDQGLTGDIPHHGSVMFRKAIYNQAGGYRTQFYYGQDWDLWYRMAQISKYFIVPQVLYKARIFPHGISMRNISQQRRIAEISKHAFKLRLKSGDDSQYLSNASAIRPCQQKQKKKDNLEAGYYFIAENLRHQDKIRSRKYFFKAISENFLSIRSWIRLMQTFVGG